MKLNNTADTDHIHRVLSGDTGAFRFLVDKYQQMVFTLALKLIGNREEAEDAAQEIFMKCFRSLHSYHHHSAFATWLYRIAYNHSIDSLKKKNRKRYAELKDETVAAVATTETVNKQIDLKDVQLLVKEAIHRLSPDEQVVVTLYYYDDLPVRDIAEIMGITENNVKIKLYRIRGRLLELLKSKNEITSILNL